jgi:hypothetical protein
VSDEFPTGRKQRKKNQPNLVTSCIIGRTL